MLVKWKDREEGGDGMKEQLKVLVLDDEPIVGDRLKPVLEAEGYGVEVFVDPREAIERLESMEFDIVITDVRMANIDGIKVLEYVRGRSDRTKVLIITGYATVELAREALSKGVFDFIAKPFKMNDIREMVRKAVEALRTEE
jgi:DNA-binding NtrC family response regulator